MKIYLSSKCLALFFRIIRLYDIESRNLLVWLNLDHNVPPTSILLLFIVFSLTIAAVVFTD